MTPPRKWPHHAEWARQDAIALLMEIVEMVTALILNDMDPIEKLRLLSRVKDKVLKTMQLLQEAGNGTGN